MPPKPRFATLTAWSFSVYMQYCKCPFSVCLDKIQRVRIVEPPNAALEKGNRIHKNAEDAVRAPGKMPKLEPELGRLRPLLRTLRDAKASVELNWAFNNLWHPTGWFAKDCWVRVKTDACADTKEPPTVTIVDYKTGKVYDDHKQQRSLYALAGLQLVQIGQLAGGSKTTKLTAQHVYVDTTQTATEEFTLKDLKPLKREWEARTKQMLEDTQFPVKEGPHCRWCRFAKSRGGPCPANQ
jgi:hypothetical protein